MKIWMQGNEEEDLSHLIEAEQSDEGDLDDDDQDEEEEILEEDPAEPAE